MKQVNYSDETIVAEWKEVLGVFHGIIKDNPPVEKVKGKLDELANAAKISDILTPQQQEAIYDRCKNYINGSYGKNLSRMQN